MLGSLATSIVSALFSGLTHWVASGAATIVDGVGDVLGSSTAVPFNAGFDAVFSEVEQIGAPLAALFLSVAVIRAVLHRDLSDLVRMVLLRLPLALIGSGLALELVVLALRATDSMSASLLRTAGSSATGFTQALANGLVLSGGSPPGGFAAFVLALMCGFVAFVLWIELVIRSSAIAIAALFLPLALAGVVWSESASWIRRLAEILTALILSKMVIAGVFALAVAEVGDPSGLSGLIQGAALLVLATFAPWTLLRLIPSVENGLVAQLEGLSGRARSVVAGPVGEVMDFASGDDDFVASVAPQMPDAVGQPYDTPEFRALAAHFEEVLPPPTPHLSGKSVPSRIRFDRLFEPMDEEDGLPWS
jgi:hypothetical protein